MYISHYDKAAVERNIKVLQEQLTKLHAEQALWELKENPNWQPAPTLTERVTANLFSYFQTGPCQVLNDLFSNFASDGIPGTEEHEFATEQLTKMCQQLAKRLLA